MKKETIKIQLSSYEVSIIHDAIESKKNGLQVDDSTLIAIGDIVVNNL